MTELLPLEDVLKTLSRDEPLESVPFTLGDQVRFDVRRGWELGLKAKEPTDLVDAYVTIGGGRGKREMQLTKEAMLEVSSFCGLPFTYTIKLPAELVAPQLNYWFREGLLVHNAWKVRDFRIEVVGGVAAAFMRAATLPFSNLEIVRLALEAIKIKYQTDEVLVDSKFHHSLRGTRLRLVVPAASKVMTDTGVDDDRWSLGLHIRNSLTGYEKTALDGYLYRHTTSAAAIDVRNPAGGVWSRNRNTGPEDVYAWVATTVSEILDHLDGALDAVQALTDITIRGHASAILRDVFVHYGIQMKARARIIEAMEQASSLTMYAVMNAVAEAAVDTVVPKFAEQLMRMAGDLPHAATSACDSCRRLAHVH